MPQKSFNTNDLSHFEPNLDWATLTGASITKVLDNRRFCVVDSSNLADINRSARL
jgi:hypothetical protein